MDLKEFEVDPESDGIRDSSIRAVQSSDIDALSMIMKIAGFALLFLTLPAQRDSGWIAGLMLLVGIGYLTFGFAFGAYARWAWWGSVLLLIPLSVFFTVVGFITYALGVVDGPFAIFPAICSLTVFYVGWVLFSKGGRSRYVETVAAIQHAKEDPESVAGQAFQRKR
ncbi:MAG: hypothetical protein N2C14_06145, partial [Planctomycetales bacterium]